MRFVIIAAGIVLAIYLALVALVWRVQERMVWLPPRMAQYPAADARRIEYTADDGQPLFAWLVGDPARARGVVIACHGNADLAAWMVPWAREVAARTGWAVLVPEYRGYAGLPGTPDYEGSRRDARATWRLVRDGLHVDSTRIALYGHSLGSAVASELAVEHEPAALLLESPFTSAREMASRMIPRPVAAARPLIGRVDFDTRARVAALAAPVWVAHGERDTVIPVDMGRAVYAAARVRGRLLLVPGAGHNDVAAVAGEDYWRWIAGALGARTSP